MGVSVADLRERLELRYSITSYSNTQFELWLSGVLRWYSRFNPRIITTTMVSTPGQDTYALPGNCVLLIDVLYQDANWVGSLQMSDLSRRRGTSKTRPSDLLVRDIEDDSGTYRAWEMWEQEAGNVVFVDKFGTTVETIALKYTAEHTLNPARDEIETIPSYDADLIVGLLLVEILQSIAIMAASTEDWAEGLQRETSHFIPGNIRLLITSLRRAVLDKYMVRAVGVIA